MFKGDKNKIRGLRYFLQIGLHFEKFRMFFFLYFYELVKLKFHTISKSQKFGNFHQAVHFSILPKLDERGKCLENMMQFSR